MPKKPAREHPGLCDNVDEGRRPWPCSKVQITAMQAYLKRLELGEGPGQSRAAHFIRGHLRKGCQACQEYVDTEQAEATSG
jgi:hypothetical protein